MTRAERIRALLETISETENDFASAVDGWTWWQETCEELAAEVAPLLDGDLD